MVMICFAVDSSASLENVREMWISEVRQHLPDTPILLVGTKVDIRTAQQANSKNPTPCPSPQISKTNKTSPKTPTKEKPPKTPNKEFSSPIHGHALAEAIGAEKYVECSAFTQENLAGVFEDVARDELYKNRSSRKTDSQ